MSTSIVNINQCQPASILYTHVSGIASRMRFSVVAVRGKFEISGAHFGCISNETFLYLLGNHCGSTGDTFRMRLGCCMNGISILRESLCKVHVSGIQNEIQMPPRWKPPSHDEWHSRWNLDAFPMKAAAPCSGNVGFILKAINMTICMDYPVTSCSHAGAILCAFCVRLVWYQSVHPQW